MTYLCGQKFRIRQIISIIRLYLWGCTRRRPFFGRCLIGGPPSWFLQATLEGGWHDDKTRNIKIKRYMFATSQFIGCITFKLFESCIISFTTLSFPFNFIFDVGSFGPSFFVVGWLVWTTSNKQTQVRYKLYEGNHHSRLHVCKSWSCHYFPSWDS